MKTQITTFISFTPRPSEADPFPKEQILRAPRTELTDNFDVTLCGIKVRELPALIAEHKIVEEDIVLVKINFVIFSFSQTSI